MAIRNHECVEKVLEFPRAGLMLIPQVCRVKPGPARKQLDKERNELIAGSSLGDHLPVVFLPYQPVKRKGR